LSCIFDGPAVLPAFMLPGIIALNVINFVAHDQSSRQGCVCALAAWKMSLQKVVDRS
jgi:hypothetical protein